MFQCKLTKSDKKAVSITTDMLEKYPDLKVKPHAVHIGKTTSYFAVCPSCDNPVQLIGIYKKTEKRPFGKHHTSTIAGLAEYNQEAYEYCPLAHPHKFADGYPKVCKSELDTLSAQILRTMRENFDAVVFSLEKSVGLKFQKRLLSKMLRDYCSSEGWLYRGASIENLPWTFAHMTLMKAIEWCNVLPESEIYHCLSKLNYVTLKSASNGSSFFVNTKTDHGVLIEFRYHRTYIDADGELVEKEMFEIIKEAGEPGKGEVIYHTDVVMDKKHFMNILALNERDVNNRHRDAELIAIAKDILPNPDL